MCPVVKITHRLIEPRVQHQGTPRDLGLQPKSHPIRSDLRSSKPFGPPDLRNSSLSNPDKDLDEKAASKRERERERVLAREFYSKNPTPPGAAHAT